MKILDLIIKILLVIFGLIFMWYKNDFTTGLLCFIWADIKWLQYKAEQKEGKG